MASIHDDISWGGPGGFGYTVSKAVSKAVYGIFTLKFINFGYSICTVSRNILSNGSLK